MRTIACACAALILCAVAPASARAAAPTEIVVSGTGSLTLPPDLATVDASIQTNSENAAQAVGQNSAVYERVVAAVTRLGIARSEISLSGYNVTYNPKPQSPPARPDGTIYGYIVSRAFSIKVKALEKAGNVVDACTSSGATSIGGVAFGLANPAAAQARATTQAVQAAGLKAQALAAAAGLHLTGIKSIELGGDGEQTVMPMAARVPGAPEPTQFDAAGVTVSVSVQMTFLAAP